MDSLTRYKYSIEEGKTWAAVLKLGVTNAMRFVAFTRVGMSQQNFEEG